MTIEDYKTELKEIIAKIESGELTQDDIDIDTLADKVEANPRLHKIYIGEQQSTIDQAERIKAEV